MGKRAAGKLIKEEWLSLGSGFLPSEVFVSVCFHKGNDASVSEGTGTAEGGDTGVTSSVSGVLFAHSGTAMEKSASFMSCRPSFIKHVAATQKKAASGSGHTRQRNATYGNSLFKATCLRN